MEIVEVYYNWQGKQSISLEPGGQFELSGAPLETLHQTCAEVNSHLYQVCGSIYGMKFDESSVLSYHLHANFLILIWFGEWDHIDVLYCVKLLRERNYSFASFIKLVRLISLS